MLDAFGMNKLLKNMALKAKRDHRRGIMSYSESFVCYKWFKFGDQSFACVHRWNWCCMLQPMTPTRLRQTQLDGSMEMNLLSFLWSVSYTDPISESDAFFIQ